MTLTAQQKRARFRELHKGGCFMLPSPWDAGSAKLLEHVGFEALASTSAGLAWTTGRPGSARSRDEVLPHLAALSADLPVNADFESGFAAAPEALAEDVHLAIDTGIAGLSIGDGAPTGSFDRALAVERVRATRRAIDQSGQDVGLAARTDILLSDDGAVLGDALDRLAAFAGAGADCLYAPGVSGRDAISAMVCAVAPRSLDVLFTERSPPLATLGVRRASVGSALARLAWGTVMAAGESIRAGSFDALAGGIPGAELNAIFGKSSQGGSHGQ
jgi:2-methylisocitrate lyase-like PEP mutase family enzyme